MKKSTFLLCLIIHSILWSQAPNTGFYVNNVEKDVFKFPNSTNINETVISNRTYETFFYANNTSLRQFIFMEGSDDGAILCYIEGGYLIIGAYNIDTGDYTDLWPGTYFRKPITAGTWYHVSLVFDNAPITTAPTTAASNTNLKWYLDGVLQDEKAGFQIGVNSNHKELFVGFKNDKLFFPTVLASWTASGFSEYSFGEQINEDGGDENYFDGYLWGFRVWDDARTATEINDNKKNLLLSVNSDNLIVALDGDTMTFLEDDVVTDLDNDSPPSVKEWEGNVDTDWSNPLNWKSLEVPDAAKQEPVKIKNQSTFYPEISSTVVTGDIELESHGSEPGKITIQDGGTLDVAYDLLNDGELIIENNGSLQVRESKPLAGAGSLIINRNTPNYQALFYSIWSTPVASTDSQINTIFTNHVHVYAYDASQNPSRFVETPTTANMEVGKGYFIRSVSDSGVISRTFSGMLNNGEIDVSIYYNSPTDMDNLIGNPYASAIDWKKFYEDNSDVLEGTMYYWRQSFTGPNNSASDYVSYNYGTGPSEPGITEFIPAGLGVFVNSLQAGTATFKNSHKVVGNNDQFLKSNSNKKINNDDGKSWLRLSGSAGYSPILIGFIPGATHGYESMYDGKFVNDGASVELYSLIDNMKYVIQGRSVLEENEDIEIPLGFEVANSGNYTLSVALEYIDSNFDILLEDKLLNVITDLRTSDYTFDVPNPIEDNSRFVLHYSYNQSLSTEDQVEAVKGVNPFFVNDQLVTKIKNAKLPSTIQLFDITGREIIKTIFNESLQTNSLTTGIYVVKYGFENASSVSKKVIKK
ncbi:MAG: T9SS type A sorting domain-containing protein [Flaviramulus sp.]|nr:T9SS type A sorting domain-containing protein [Flaviramulus sp.]NNC50242.1 T9SS type A sorting domain-containing protein [Flaviramulus sp.]